MQKHSNPKCKTCFYKGRPESDLGCEYILIEGHSRGCSIDECDKYNPDPWKRGKKNIVYSIHPEGRRHDY